jgi:sec-independent protein translocase protein TatC
MHPETSATPEPLTPESLAPETMAPETMLRQPLLAHLLELRQRLVHCLLVIGLLFGGCYYYAAEIYAFLVQPLADATFAGAPLGAPLTGTHRLIYTGLTEAFLTYIKLALWAACLGAFPIIAVQIWRFVAPGLYQHEKRAFLPFLLATPVLFTLGAALAYYGVMPLAWKFFLSFETPAAVTGLPIQLEARVSEYLSLAMTLIFAFGIAFQLPVLLVLLVRIGVLTVAQLVQFRRFAIVLIFIVAAIATPPDVLSQLLLALPLLGLYEVSILAARWQSRS